MADIKKIAEELVGLTIAEANDLANLLEEEYGIKPAAAAVAIAGPGGGDGAVEVEEKTEFDVVLKNFGSNKIAVIKEVRIHMFGKSASTGKKLGICFMLKNL